MINYLQGTFSKSLKYPGEAIELKVKGTCILKSLGCFWMFSFYMNVLHTMQLEYSEKSVCFTVLPLILSDSCGKHLPSKNTYTSKFIKVSLLFCLTIQYSTHRSNFLDVCWNCA